MLADFFSILPYRQLLESEQQPVYNDASFFTR